MTKDRDLRSWIEALPHLPAVAQPLLAYLQANVWRCGDDGWPREVMSGMLDGGQALFVSGSAKHPDVLIVLTTQGIFAARIGAKKAMFLDSDMSPAALVQSARSYARGLPP